MPETNRPLAPPPRRRPLAISDWQSRWLVFFRWDVLHRVSEIEWEMPDEMIRGRGVTLCGRHGTLMMPGVFSRIGLPRCPRCCRLAGVPEGDGAPFNAARDDEPWKEA